ncbi:MAG: sugar-binding protein [candidate division WOR-3 bacterium]
MKNSKFFFFFFLFGSSFFLRAFTLRPQDDTVKAPDVENPPTINGLGDDPCWSLVNWQSIDQVWIPYGGYVEPEDYSGRYKVVWSSLENVLYFLVEITDDIFVDGYTGGGGYYNYDVLEVFIDEDKSGGMHRIDQDGENAENAFSYHITLNAPEDGGVTEEFAAYDLAGFWQVVDYASHFPNLAMRKNGSTYTWEFSLKVYNDNYQSSNPEAFRVNLTEGKIIGLSLAYCENDDPNENPKVRDNFFGSVWVAHEDSNSHWMNADGFGTLKLLREEGIEEEFKEKYLYIYPTLVKEKATIEFYLPISTKIIIKVFNLVGELVDTILDANLKAGGHKIQWFPKDVPSGVYLLRIQTDYFKTVRTLVIFK